MVAWDLPEWYLASKPIINGEVFTIHGQMSDPGMVKENYRSVTYNVDYEDDAQFELDMSKFVGSGSFFAPNSVINNNNYTNLMKDAESVNTYSAHQAVWASKYNVTLASGQSTTSTQSLTVQESFTYSEEENVIEKKYFDSCQYNQSVSETKEFYNDLFTKRTIKTSNELYNNFINNFVPLQMYWVRHL